MGAIAKRHGWLDQSLSDAPVCAELESAGASLTFCHQPPVERTSADCSRSTIEPAAEDDPGDSSGGKDGLRANCTARREMPDSGRYGLAIAPPNIWRGILAEQPARPELALAAARNLGLNRGQLDYAATRQVLDRRERLADAAGNWPPVRSYEHSRRRPLAPR